MLGYSQSMYFPQEENADCKGAIEIKDSLFGPTVPPEGHGQHLDIDKNAVKDLYLFEREHNTLWYRFEAMYSTEMSLDIWAVDSVDDFDFLLFKHTGDDDFCNKIKQRKIRPARTNMAKNKEGLEGRTGLSFNAESEYVASGPGNPYSKSIYVNQGEVFYLVVDNYSKEGKGHTLHFHYLGYPLPKGSLSITVYDVKTRKKIKSDIEIIEINRGDGENDQIAYSLKGENTYKVDLENNKHYEVNCNSKGYFFTTNDVKTGESAQQKRLKIKLAQVHVGEKLTLQNINFYGDSAALLPSSMASLDNLVAFMKHNETVTIEIQGHVNAPEIANTKMLKDLSMARANSVRDYLVQHGINSDRMDFKGYGNKEMIYPKPTNEKQESANRRVDILVTGM